MNPLTDRITEIPKPDGGVLRIIQPGAKVIPSSNWRLTREAYDRYAPYLEAAVNNWPKETRFSIPEGMSPNTFCARFRDARKALLLFHYDLELETKLRSLDDAPVISMDPDGKHVWFRERGQQSAPLKSTSESIGRISAIHLAGAPPSLDELTSMCQLMASGRIKGPFVFTGIIPSNHREEIESNYDVAFHVDEVNSTTTLI